MRVAVSGSTGLIGSALVAALEGDGQSVVRLIRPLNPDDANDCDAVVHLAGESIAGLWTPGKKRRIRESRVNGTRLLATSLIKLRRPPAVLVCASATGYYGSHAAHETLDETCPRGAGFLAEVVEQWENASAPAADAGIRTVNLRFAPVLSGSGGMLGPMLPVFKAGLGGRIGSGRQIWSWVAIDDVVASILLALSHQSLSGPVNVVAPLAVTNLAFTRTLGRVLRRPTVLPVPEFLLKAVGGAMAREMLLAGARVVPRKLQTAGYAFRYPELEMALRHVLTEA